MLKSKAKINFYGREGNINSNNWLVLYIVFCYNFIKYKDYWIKIKEYMLLFVI